MRLRHLLQAVLLVAAQLAATTLAAQEVASFSVEARPDGRAAVRAVGLLEDSGLRKALASGLPLRFALRVEVWRKALFDQLSGVDEISVALVLDPLDRDYVLEDGRREVRYASLATAQAALERALSPTLRPERSGRYYYLATLKVETLSLSDLDELRRWLRGEVRPAVEGRASPTRAVERGLRRVFVRVIGLPSRSFEGRSATFIVP